MSRKIDALIAEHVMGLNISKETGPYTYVDHRHNGTQWDIPHYSTDIAAAWEVVEKMGAPFTLQAGGEGGFRCEFSYKPFNSTPTNLTEGSAPMAIAVAALRARGIDVSETNVGPKDRQEPE